MNTGDITISPGDITISPSDITLSPGNIITQSPGDIIKLRVHNCIHKTEKQVHVLNIMFNLTVETKPGTKIWISKQQMMIIKINTLLGLLCSG